MVNTPPNQAPISRRRLSHLGTKLPSSNWSAEEMAKYFTSAEIQYTRMHTQFRTRAITLDQSLGSLGNVHSTILSLSILYPLVYPVLSAPSVPITTAKDPDPRNTTPTHSGTDVHANKHMNRMCKMCVLFPYHNNTKGQSCFSLFVSPLWLMLF